MTRAARLPDARRRRRRPRLGRRHRIGRYAVNFFEAQTRAGRFESLGVLYSTLNLTLFEAEMPRLPSCRMAGNLYSSYELYKALFFHGARLNLFYFFSALCAGKLDTAFFSRLSTLLALLVLKPDGTDRPVGVRGEHAGGSRHRRVAQPWSEQHRGREASGAGGR